MPTRIRIDTQLEQAVGQNYTILTDASGNADYVLNSINIHTDVDITGVATGAILYYDGANFVDLPAGSNGQVLTLAAGIPAWSGTVTGSFNITDGSNTETIENGNTLTVSTAAFIDAVVSATDTLTITIDPLPTTGGSTVQILQFDDSGDTYSWVNVTTLQSSFTITDGTTPQTINDGDTITITEDEGISAVVSATDTLTIGLRRVKEYFDVTSADTATVTVAGTLPADVDLIDVYRNGAIQEPGASNDYQISGNDVVFNEGFGASGGGTDSEIILVVYFEG